jgi:glycosyltransferase involved in cell wall biosynthesis
MKILWLSWKDIQHPQAGGAEVVAAELGKRLADDGHELRFITAGFHGAADRTTINGYSITRVGNRLSVYWQAYRYIAKQGLSDWADLVIDEVNTIPFFTPAYTKRPRLLLFHMLCRKIWFYQLPAVVGWVGYMLEPLYLRLLRREEVVTVSESTKRDLRRHGFREENITIVSEGIEIEPISDLETVTKPKDPTLLSLGSMRPMKRTLDQLKAYEIAKAAVPNLKLKIAGGSSGKYGQEVMEAIARSKYRDDIEYLGKVSLTQKIKLLQQVHLLLVTSVKEGWGLTVTEAASQGTPAVVYDVDGLRDSVKHEWSGLIAYGNTPKDLAECIVNVFNDTPGYHELRHNAWTWSQKINFDQSYQDLLSVIDRCIGTVKKGVYAGNSTETYRAD